MGQFSWLDCVDGKPILDDVHADVFLLRPQEFGGGFFYTNCYDGYGRFGVNPDTGKEVDVYEEVAKWNRGYIIAHPEFLDTVESTLDTLDIGDALKAYLDGTVAVDDIQDLRGVGIHIACYDEDNSRLPYPIKVTHHETRYEDCMYSPSDPNQGWETEYWEDDD